MITSGESVPDFTLPGTEGTEIQQYSLTKFTEDGATLILFYPFDFSPVCADQLCTFRDAEWLTFSDGLDVLGVSVDSAHSHQRFIQHYDLQFPLLTDRLGEVADEFGLLMDDFENHPNVPRRSIIAVDDDQTVRYVWVADSQYQSPEIDVIEESVDWYRSRPEETDYDA